MRKIRVLRLRKLCLAGVISTLDYWNFKRKNKRHNRKTKYARRNFALLDYTNDECKNFFRFSKFELGKLTELLKVPKSVKIGRSHYSGMEALCIMLRRLSYPNRLCDLVKLFHRDETSLSRVFNYMIYFIYENHKNRVQTMQQAWMDVQTLQKFAQKCSTTGSWYNNIIGFIDGTTRPICRPSYHQRQFYSGYKKLHVMKYQSVVYPNGLIGRLDGPFLGRRHDAAILTLSKIRQEFERFLITVNGNYAVIGDTGYSNSKFIKVGFKNNRPLTTQQKQFSKDLSAIRVSVEYGFGRVTSQFAFLDYKKNQKVYLQNLKQQYTVGVLLTNCQVCMRGCQVSEYFMCNPPSIEEYLQ